MKGLKLCLAVVGFAAATSANAAYLLTGGLTGYSASIPGTGTVVGTMDQAAPGITGYLAMTCCFNGYNSSTLSLNLEYTNIALGAGVVKTIPDGLVEASGTTSVYDSTTRHFTQNITGYFNTRDAFCTGVAAICGALYPEGNNYFYTNYWPGRAYITGALDLYFNATLNSFTGTFTETDNLGNGSLVTKVYTLNGLQYVPIPLSGALFGSSLLALAGIGRRRRA